jgi:hypothetical protein
LIVDLINEWYLLKLRIEAVNIFTEMFWYSSIRNKVYKIFINWV